MKRIFIALQAYNEGRNISTVLSQIESCNIPGYSIHAIVVDDGSSDNTSAVANTHDCTVVRHPINLGQGYALLTGFLIALMYGEDDDLIIEMDADGQHDPKSMDRFIKRLDETGADIIVGSRILGSNYDNAPFFRKTMLPFYTDLINGLTGYTMTDSMCGYRAFRAGSLRKIAPVLSEMLEPQYIAAEMFIRFSKAGLTVEEVPIDMADRIHGKSRKGFIRYGLGVLKAIMKTLLDKNYRMLGAK
nr:glycosyltransferase family 2 protein [uncultured Pseudodesulfovibrio sp.]